MKHSLHFWWWNTRVKSNYYCWWLKSCNTWDVWNPINNGIFTISTGAGFQPSTVRNFRRLKLSPKAKTLITSILPVLQLWCFLPPPETLVINRSVEANESVEKLCLFEQWKKPGWLGYIGDDKLPSYIPIGSMYGIFTYIWMIFMVNVGEYTKYGSYGIRIIIDHYCKDPY